MTLTVLFVDVNQRPERLLSPRQVVGALKQIRNEFNATVSCDLKTKEHDSTSAMLIQRHGVRDHKRVFI